jgi:hypothetical protein
MDGDVEEKTGYKARGRTDWIHTESIIELDHYKRGSGVKRQQKGMDWIAGGIHCCLTALCCWMMVFRFDGGDLVPVAGAGVCNGLGEW